MSYRLTAKVDYAVRVMVALAAAQLATPADRAGVRRAEDLAHDLVIPQRFLVNILSDLRRAGLVASHRGHQGGYLLARGAATVMIGDVVRIVDPDLGQPQPPKPFRDLWDRASAAVDAVLDQVSLADLAMATGSGRLPLG